MRWQPSHAVTAVRRKYRCRQHRLNLRTISTGTQRRFDISGASRATGVKIVDDYAHHPTEIEATLSACQNIPHNKLWCIFQPHTYTRTIALFDQFADAFEKADKLILSEIYAAREKKYL